METYGEGDREHPDGIQMQQMQAQKGMQHLCSGSNRRDRKGRRSAGISVQIYRGYRKIPGGEYDEIEDIVSFTP